MCRDMPINRNLAGLFELQECLEAERDSSRSSGLPEERLVGTTIG